MKTITSFTSLINKAAHRKAKAEAEGRKASEALLKGDTATARRRLNRAMRLRGWESRYTAAADRWIIDNCH